VGDTCSYCQKPLGGVSQSYWGNECHIECNPANIEAAAAREVQRQIGRDESKAEIAKLRAALDAAEANINLKADWIDATINDMAQGEQDAAEARAVGVQVQRGGKWIVVGDKAYDLRECTEAAAALVVASGSNNLGFDMPGWFFTGSPYAEQIKALGVAAQDIPSDFVAEVVPDLGKVWRARQTIWETYIRTALHPASPLGAVVMREKAAQEIMTSGDSAVTEALGQRLCCNGHHCGCQGSTVEQFLVHNIRAIPLTFTPAELLAAAAELPEVRALVEAATDLAREMAFMLRHNPEKDGGMYRDALSATEAALAPFARKGE